MDGWMNQEMDGWMDGCGWMHGGTYCYERARRIFQDQYWDLNTENSRKGL
jgi:hypothetical protein